MSSNREAAGEAIGTDVVASRDAGRPGRRVGAAAGVRDGMTQNESLVMDALEGAGAPLKAYDLLGQLEAEGVSAPMTVYRALDRLEGRGLVHKLDRLGAFVACRHGAPHAVQAFLLCEGCDGVSEIEEAAPAAFGREVIGALTVGSGFQASGARIELRGRCRDCG